MNIRRKLIPLGVLLLLVAGAERVHAGDGPVTIQALMIQAQADAAPIDRRLEKVEYKLRRIFGFPYYLYVGEGDLTLMPGARGTIALPDGHQLRVALGGGKGGSAEVRWVRDRQPLISTSVKLSRETPVVLGGIPSNGGKLIVVLTVR